MTHREAACPACGAPVEFRFSTSVVVVCNHCQSVVARGDVLLEDLGKVAQVVDILSPFSIGARGQYEGRPFEITGRVQIAHAAGGTWNEWYAAFDQDRQGEESWGWLAEAQGRLYLTFPVEIPTGGDEPAANGAAQGRSSASKGRAPKLPSPKLPSPKLPSPKLPSFDELRPGRRVTVKTLGPMTVAERGEATLQAAEGEVPYRFAPGQTFRFVDLSGPNRAFATIDYGDDPPRAYIGKRIGLGDLGVAEPLPDTDEPKQVAALAVACPQCGGSLELRAPDAAQTVSCPFCSALLDVDAGNLRFLNALATGPEPQIPIGARGELFGRKLTVLGMLQRSVTFDGIDYYWQEFLVRDGEGAFCWLVCSDRHWSFVRPLDVADVTAGPHTATFRHESYKVFQRATARVAGVVGEFYWRVRNGDEARTDDYIRPPYMLSREMTLAADGDGKTLETNWSWGEYVAPETVEKAFGVKRLKRPSGVAPNQPFLLKAAYAWWLILMAALLATRVLTWMLVPTTTVLSKAKALALPAATSAQTQPTIPPPIDGAPFADPGFGNGLPGSEQTFDFFSEPLQLSGWRNIRISLRAPVDNSWVAVSGDLVNDETLEVHSFERELAYYHGSDSDGGWAEGSQTEHVYLSALPAGTYTLHLRGAWPQPLGPPVDVEVEHGRPSWQLWWLAAGLVSVVPTIVAIYHWSFERSRWRDSDFAPALFSAGSSDDD